LLECRPLDEEDASANPLSGSMDERVPKEHTFVQGQCRATVHRDRVGRNLTQCALWQLSAVRCGLRLSFISLASSVDKRSEHPPLIKKLSAIFVAILLAAGLAAVASPADAKPKPYPNTVATYCSVHFQHDAVRFHKKNPVHFRVTTAGTGRPKGVVKVTATSKKHTYKRTYTYKGGSNYHAFRAMKRGKYTVRMSFTAPRNSAYMNCRDRGHSVRIR
jgi:hypothetical protein